MLCLGSGPSVGADAKGRVSIQFCSLVIWVWSTAWQCLLEERKRRDFTKTKKGRVAEHSAKGAEFIYSVFYIHCSYCGNETQLKLRSIIRFGAQIIVRLAV